MVVYLHDMTDAGAGQDLRILHDTRTLQQVIAVNGSNIRAALAAMPDARMQVVVPTDPHRISEALLTILRCLELIHIRAMTVDGYIAHISRPPAPATAPAHANAVGAGAG
jgi:hypothetical protein